jgi:nucleoside 2-deoxyribosyltransferase
VTAVAQRDPEANGRIAFRLRIGVTGHRDPADETEISGLVRKHLSEIAKRFSANASTRVIFTVVSALADGADQLVVRQAIEQLGADHVTLRAVLPFPAAGYAATVSHPRAFEELLAMAATIVTLPPSEDRGEAYERAGRVIVDHSDVVIALWDGYPADGRGGTAETVAYAQAKQTPVFAVPTRRLKHRERAPRWEASQPPERQSLRSVDAAFRHVKRLNEKVPFDGRFHLAVTQAREGLLGVVEGTPIHWQCAVVADWALPHIVRADRLALHYQRWYYLASVWLYGLAGLAVTAVAVQLAYQLPVQVTLIEVAAMIVLLATYAIAGPLHLESRWLGFRSLAEAFRSALFITVASRGGTPPLDLSRGGPETVRGAREPWYQRAFSEVWSRRPAVEVDEAHGAYLRRFLLQAWVEHQIVYHRDAARRARSVNRRFTVVVVALFVVTLVAGVLHVAEVGDASWRHLFTLLAVALPATGAAVVGVRDLRHYRIHEDRFLRTARRLEELAREMENQSAIDSMRKLAADAQTIIQAENQDWSTMVEFQSLELIL